MYYRKKRYNDSNCVQQTPELNIFVPQNNITFPKFEYISLGGNRVVDFFLGWTLWRSRTLSTWVRIPWILFLVCCNSTCGQGFVQNGTHIIPTSLQALPWLDILEWAFMLSSSRQENLSVRENTVSFSTWI